MVKSCACGCEKVDFDEKIATLRKYYLDFFGEKYTKQIDENINKITFILYRPFVYNQAIQDEMRGYIDACVKPGTMENEILHEVMGKDLDKAPKESDVVEATFNKIVAPEYSVIKYAPQRLLTNYVTQTPYIMSRETFERRLDSELSKFVSYRLNKYKFLDKVDEAKNIAKSASSALRAIKMFTEHNHYIKDCGEAFQAFNEAFYGEGRKIGVRVFENHYAGRMLGIDASLLHIREGQKIVPFMLIKEGFPNNILVHELLHGITASQGDDGVYKTGVALGFSENKTVGLNEVLTDYFALKIHDKMKQNGELVGDPKIPISLYAMAIYPLQKLIDENIDVFKTAMMTKDPHYLENKLGSFNYEKLMAITNCLLDKNNYYKVKGNEQNDNLTEQDMGNTVDKKNIKDEIAKLQENIAKQLGQDIER